MKFNKLAIVGLAAVMSLAAAPAFGQAQKMAPSSAPAGGSGDLVTSTDPATVLNALKALGYEGALSKDSGGDPLIEIKMGQWNVRVLFYDCTDNSDCRSIQFYTIFDAPNGMTADKAIAWSSKWRFGAIGLDDEQDPSITWDVVMAPGVSRANFQAICEKYENAVANFGAYVFGDGDVPGGDDAAPGGDGGDAAPGGDGAPGGDAAPGSDAPAKPSGDAPAKPSGSNI